MTGALWTGIDLFMGFVIGPIMRGVSFETRRAIIAGLIPRTLILMPTLSIVTSTSGWFLAVRMGFLDLGYPEFWWVIAALAIVTVLTVQGLGYLLPTNLRLYFEVQKTQPDAQKIARWMRTYVRVVALQGVMQVAIERTGFFAQTERYCVQFEALAALRDPAPPASSLRWGFGGGGDGRRTTEGDPDDQDKVEAQARITRKRQQDQDP